MADYLLDFTANEVNEKLRVIGSKIDIAITQNTTNTLANTADTQNWSTQVEYQEDHGMCFGRIFCTTAVDLTANTAYVIGTLEDTTYAPEYTMPLTVSCGKEACSYIGNAGNIYVKPYETVYSNTPIRVAGFWFK